MTNRHRLLGRSRPAEQLSKTERDSLDKAIEQPAPDADSAPAPAPPSNSGQQGAVGRNQLKFHWTTECPACGFKVAGNGTPQPGERLARCVRCKLTLFLNAK